MSKFQVGDKLRYICGDSQWDAYDNEVAYGMEGIVSDIDNDGEIEVAFVRRFSNSIDPEDLELVAPTNKKREFLERLQSLMREFDAEIVFSCNHTYKTIKTTITIGDTNIVRNEVYGVCADNIMDFDKE